MHVRGEPRDKATKSFHLQKPHLVWFAVKVHTKVSNPLKLESGEGLCPQNCVIHNCCSLHLHRVLKEAHKIYLKWVHMYIHNYHFPLKLGLPVCVAKALVHICRQMHTGLMSERNPLGTSAGSSGLGCRNLKQQVQS